MNSSLPQQRTRRALIVAYVFPPSGGAGVQRVAKFVKYLPEFGWDCSVLTVSNPSVPLRDDTLLSEIPESTVVRKAKTLEPGYSFKNSISAAAEGSTRPRGIKHSIKSAIRAVGNAVLQPDAQVLWYPQAVREGKRLLRELHHDVIFVTAPPFSSFLVGAELSRATGLPLVLDYRDEWGISNRYQENRQKSAISQRIQQRQQRHVLHQAKAIVTTTRRSATALRKVVKASKSTASVYHIYNGFDGIDIPTVEHSVSPTGCNDSRRYRLVYVGTLWNLTSIEPIVEAIQQICRQAPEVAARIELVLVGRRTGDQDAVINRLDNLPCRVVRQNYVEHSRAIEIMQSADSLCLLLSNVPEAERVMPAKTFEYLALQKPILAVAPRGEVTDLLAECPYAAIFSPSDIESIAEHIALAASHPDFGQTRTTWNVNQYERRELTSQLGNLFNEVCGWRTETAATPKAKSEYYEPVSACAPDWGGLDP